MKEWYFAWFLLSRTSPRREEKWVFDTYTKSHRKIHTQRHTMVSWEKSAKAISQHLTMRKKNMLRGKTAQRYKWEEPWSSTFWRDTTHNRSGSSPLFKTKNISCFLFIFLISLNSIFLRLSLFSFTLSFLPFSFIAKQVLYIGNLLLSPWRKENIYSAE